MEELPRCIVAAREGQGQGDFGGAERRRHFGVIAEADPEDVGRDGDSCMRHPGAQRRGMPRRAGDVDYLDAVVSRRRKRAALL